MTLWIIFAVLSLIAIGFAVWPLYQRQKKLTGTIAVTIVGIVALSAGLYAYQGQPEVPSGTAALPEMDAVITTLAERLDGVVVDIRFSPRSRIPDWSAGRLQKLLGDRYQHLPALGNRNYKSGAVEFVDLEAGVVEIGELLSRQPGSVVRMQVPDRGIVVRPPVGRPR